MIFPIIAIMAVVALIGFMAYQGNTNSVISAGSSVFDIITKGTPSQGFTITHVNPQNTNQNQDTIVQQSPIQSENTTQVVSESSVQYSDNILTYPVSNIPPIQGYIKLYDANQEPIKPYSYDYRITVSCSDLSDFCNLEPSPSNRGITTNGGLDEKGNELGGYYIWNWSNQFSQSKIMPSNVDDVLLDVSLFIDVNKPDGTWVTEESSYIMRITP